MKKLKLNQSSDKSGFTLVETLVVVAIIGILASLALVYIQNARLQAVDAKVMQTARQFITIAALVYQETGSYEDMHQGYIGPGDCGKFNTGSYANELQRICQNIIDADGAIFSGAARTDLSIPGCCDYDPDYTQHSTVVNLPSGLNEYYCVSTSGAVFRGTIGNNPDVTAPNGWYDEVYDEPHPRGCSFNP